MQKMGRIGQRTKQSKSCKKMVKTGQRLKRKMAVINLKKEGSEENKEENHTIRRKEAKSNLEKEEKINQQSTQSGVNLQTR